MGLLVESKYLVTGDLVEMLEKMPLHGVGMCFPNRQQGCLEI